MNLVLNYLMGLDPMEMSMLMLFIMIVDIWSALRLQYKLGNGFLSKRFLMGLVSDLLLILLPVLIMVAHKFIDGNPHDSLVIVFSLIVMFLYSIGTIGSIISNIIAIYPPNANVLIGFLYKILKHEISAKLGVTDAELDKITTNLVDAIQPADKQWIDEVKEIKK